MTNSMRWWGYDPDTMAQALAEAKRIRKAAKRRRDALLTHMGQETSRSVIEGTTYKFVDVSRAGGLERIRRGRTE